jgi:hypothetical protein
VLITKDQSVKNQNFSRILIKARITRKVMMNRTKAIILAMMMKMTMGRKMILIVDLQFLISSVVEEQMIANQKSTFSNST